VSRCRRRRPMQLQLPGLLLRPRSGPLHAVRLLGLRWGVKKSLSHPPTMPTDLLALLRRLRQV
jgi:hypothetical protein